MTKPVQYSFADEKIAIIGTFASICITLKSQ